MFSHVAFELNGRILDSYPYIGVKLHDKPHGQYYGIAVYRLSVSEETQEKVWDCALKEVGKQYDWPGIAGVVSMREIQDPDKWFCSELCAAMLRKGGVAIGGDVPAWKITPNGLAQMGIPELFKLDSLISGT